jgi:TatD DNase family protein
MYHDTHVHLEMLLSKLGFIPNVRDDELESNQDELPKEAKDKLIELLREHEFVLHSTCSTQNFLYVIRIFDGIDKIKYWLGTHPCIVDEKFDVSKYIVEQRTLINLLRLISPDLSKSLVGIGEVGLDYFHTQDAELIRAQKKLFRTQIELALELDLPLMIHCRDAFEDLFLILDEYPKIHKRFLVHCFTGGPKELTKIVEYGSMVGIGGVVTFGSAKGLQEAVAICPDKNFVLETDLPFLAPVPHRGQTCLPIMIEEVAYQIARLKSQTKDQVVESSLSNIKNLVKL